MHGWSAPHSEVDAQAQGLAPRRGWLGRLRGLWRVPTPGVALLLLLLGCYILTMSGHTYSSDEETILAAGERLITYGSFAIPRGDLMNRAPGADGRTSYSRYGPGQSVAAIPLILAGRAVAALGPEMYQRFVVRLFVLLIPATLTALTGWLVFRWVLLLGYSTRIALLCGLLFGFTSLAWPYSRTFFAEPAATFGLVLCGYGLRQTTPRWWAVAGAAAGWALAAKFQSLLALPFLAAYALAVSWGGGWRVSGRALGRRVLYGLLGLALPLGLLFLYNTRLFGGPLNSGYGGINLRDWLSMTNQDGLYGLTVSTGKGLLFFAPTVLLGLLGTLTRPQQQWRESALALGLLAAHLGFYSKLAYWHGDGSWGPRYLVFVVPFLYLPAAGLLTLLAERRRRVGQLLAAGLALAGLLVQLMPVLINFDTYILLSDGHARFFEPAHSPIVGHARLWASRVAERWDALAPPDGTAVLRDGFSYSEGDRAKGELLPRWTNADARIRLYPAEPAPLDGLLIVEDHRPWPLPRANFSLLLDGQPLEGLQRRDLTGQQLRWELRFQLSAAQARRGAELVLHSDTWNPTMVTQDNPRNEDLALLAQQIEFRQGEQLLELRQSLPVPPPQNSRRAWWLWYQDTPNHHLFDIWLWYLAASRMPAPNAALLLLLLGLPALLALLLGARGVAGSLFSGAGGRAPAASTPAPGARRYGSTGDSAAPETHSL